MKKKTSCPKGKSSASTSSSMVKKTSSPKGSSSSVSRNPPATTQSDDECHQRFQKLWSNEMGSFSKDPFWNAGDVPILTTPKTAMGCLSDRDSGKKQIDGVHQEQRFTIMGSSSSSNPRIAEDEFQRYSAFKKNNWLTTTHDQSMASLDSINGGDLVGKYSNSMKGLDKVPVKSVGKFNGHAVNHQLSNGYRLEDTTSADYHSTSSISIDDEIVKFIVANFGYNLFQLRDWSVKRILKICYHDPSLLDEIKPHDIVLLAKLKLGSLYLQENLKDQNSLHFNKIFYATLDFTYPLMFDPEGTHVLRKLYGLCDSSHLKLIVEKILQMPDQLKIAVKNDTGSGTLMELIRILMTSKYGSSLFIFFMKDLDPSQNEILYNKATTHFIDLATDDSGYASLIALIVNKPNPYKKELLLKITDNAVYLSQDPKGNYVIQATLGLRCPELDFMICEKLVGTYPYFSVHKYANKVIQRCIMSSWMEYPISELISSKKLHLISQDPWGNYVVQQALIAAQFNRLDLYDNLVGEIQPYLKDLQYHPFGGNVFKLINKSKSIYYE